MGRKKIGGDVSAQELREIITNCVNSILSSDHENPGKSVSGIEFTHDKRIKISINNNYEGLLPYHIVVMLVDLFGTQKINIGGYSEHYEYSEMTQGEDYYLQIEVLEILPEEIKKGYFKYKLTS